MKETLNIGSAPFEENCAQLGGRLYEELSRMECAAFKEQIIRKLGDPPGSARVVVKSFPHDFGSYREVCVVFDDEDEPATEYAYACEASGDPLAKWDCDALDKLEELAKSSGLDMNYWELREANRSRGN